MKYGCKKWLKEKIAKIEALESYVPEKTIKTIANEFGLSPTEIIKLNFNENLFIPRAKLVSLLKKVAEECDLRLYPQEEEEKLQEEIAEYLKLSERFVAIGNSSDEIMNRITRLFLNKNDQAVTFSPTFSVFKYCVKYQGAKYLEVPLRKGFKLDSEAMLAAFRPESKMLYLCSPNNPTGNQFELGEIEGLIEDFDGIVLVDEAYGEYADYSVIPLTRKYENLAVLRTFSKAFGLAGLRLGYSVANPKLANAINKIPAPYAINIVTLTMGRKLLENINIVKEAVAALKVERKNMIERLNEIENVEAFDSKANFVLFNTVKPYEDVYLNLLKNGIVIKRLGKLLEYENCLRSTIGLPEMNKKFLNGLKKYFGD